MNVLSKIWNKWKVERRFSKGFYPRISEDMKENIKSIFIDYVDEKLDVFEVFDKVRKSGFDMFYFFLFFYDLIRRKNIELIHCLAIEQKKQTGE